MKDELFTFLELAKQSAAAGAHIEAEWHQVITELRSRTSGKDEQALEDAVALGLALSGTCNRAARNVEKLTDVAFTVSNCCRSLQFVTHINRHYALRQC